jgi:hypothetical protein
MKGCEERMTEAQANQIVEMRIKGIGYKSIGTIVGLSRDIVRNYCKSHNLTGYASALTKNVQMRMESGEACQYCGGTIVKPKTGRPKKFCSEKCRREWWKIHPEAVKRSETASYKLRCENCGREFISYGNRNRKYCSHDCYIKYRFWRDEDGIQEVQD